jgi:methylmalonyl-CoA mutase
MNIPANHLFSEFVLPSHSAWLQQVKAEMEGKEASALDFQVADCQMNAYAFEPSPSSGHSALSPSPEAHIFGARTWRNISLIYVTHAGKANTLALQHLEQGADGIRFELQPDFSATDLNTLLQSIDWPSCTVDFILEAPTPEFASFVHELANNRNFSASQLQGHILYKTYPHYPQSVHTFIHTYQSLPYLRPVEIPVDSDSPSIAIANTLRYLASLLDTAPSTVEKEALLQSVFFTVQVGPDFFLETARLKALRITLKNILGAYRLMHEPILLATVPPWKNPSYEPHGHMVAGTLAAMAAICGGCQSLSVLPAHSEDSMQNRIARNVSSILREESHFNKVADPTAGSYYLDGLTDRLAAKAWDIFQRNTEAL